MNSYEDFKKIKIGHRVRLMCKNLGGTSFLSRHCAEHNCAQYTGVVIGTGKSCFGSVISFEANHATGINYYLYSNDLVLTDCSDRIWANDIKNGQKYINVVFDNISEFDVISCGQDGDYNDNCGAGLNYL
jgi:hypothetical protein